jgi:hypothetical protein
MLILHFVERTDIEGVETMHLSRIFGLERLIQQDCGEE